MDKEKEKHRATEGYEPQNSEWHRIGYRGYEPQHATSMFPVVNILCHRIESNPIPCIQNEAYVRSLKEKKTLFILLDVHSRCEGRGGAGRER